MSGSAFSPPEAQRDTAITDKLRLAALILEGYCYIALILTTFAGILTLLVWGFVARHPLLSLAGIFFTLPVLAATAAAIRSLWFRVPLPQGIAVEKDEAPELYGMIDEVRQQVRAPRVYGVLVSEAANAAAVQVSRFGFVGTRNILVLGYPLLALLPEPQVRAVIAHELGHFSCSHSSFSRWVFRTRVSWLRLMQSLRSRGTTPLFVEWLFRHYVPRLDARSTAIARRHELVADKCAAIALGARATADALVSLEVTAMYLDRTFWPEINQRMRSATTLPRPFSELRSRFAVAHATGSVPTFESVLSIEAEPTHPSLRERLDALGEQAREVQQANTGSSFESLLHVLAHRLDEEWCGSQEADWQAWRSEQQKARSQLASLEATGALSANQMFERARLVEGLDGSLAAFPLYLTAAEAGQTEASLHAGRLLADKDPDRATRLLEHALSSPSLAPEACRLLIDLCESRNRLVEAERYRARERQLATRARMSETERETLSPLDQFSTHGLSEQDVRLITEQLTRAPHIEKAYLVQKSFRYSPGSELVLCIVCSRKAPPDFEPFAELGESPLRTVIMNRQYDVQAALEAVPEAQIYDRQVQGLVRA